MKNKKTQEITLKNKKIARTYSVEEAKNLAIELSKIEGIDSRLKNMANKAMPKHAKGGKGYDDKSFFKDIFRIEIGLEAETHLGLVDSVDFKYKTLIKEFSHEIIKDYSCVNSIEKALAEVIANAYVRIIDNSQRLNNMLNDTELSQNRNIYIANLSKQIDRANRQYISAIMTLKQMKSPSVELNIRTNTAFISENQQINVEKNNNENIKP